VIAWNPSLKILRRIHEEMDEYRTAGGLALPVYAQEKEEERVEYSGTVMKEILNAPDSIPQSVHKAYCVAVLPSVKKFAIGIGDSYGRGVMTCRGMLQRRRALSDAQRQPRPMWP
jgi:hypothetical protein